MGRVIGLTGGIATGKSTVARMLTARGAQLVDADAIVRELQAPGQPLLAEIAAAFGPRVLHGDGSLDRKALGAIVFADAEARALLGRLTGGPVVRELTRRTEEARHSRAPLVIVDIPLFFEGSASGRAAEGRPLPYGVEGVILVYAPEALQIERQMRRDGATALHAAQRLGAQMPIEAKRELADWVIDNSGSLKETERQVEALLTRLGLVPEAAP